MSPWTLRRDDKSFVPVLYMAMELSNRNWKLLFGDGARRCQLSIAAGELLSLNEAVLKARERFGLPARAQVVSCRRRAGTVSGCIATLRVSGLRTWWWIRRVLRSHGASAVRRPIGWMRSSYCGD